MVKLLGPKQLKKMIQENDIEELPEAEQRFRVRRFKVIMGSTLGVLFGMLLLWAGNHYVGPMSTTEPAPDETPTAPRGSGPVFDFSAAERAAYHPTFGTCAVQPSTFPSLRWGSDADTADNICCNNHAGAEMSGCTRAPHKSTCARGSKCTCPHARTCTRARVYMGIWGHAYEWGVQGANMSKCTVVQVCTRAWVSVRTRTRAEV